MRRKLKKPRRISARRFFGRQSANHPDNDAEERVFFKSIQLPNGTYKETYKNRLNDVNNAVTKTLRLHGIRNLNVMDVGISSGVSTAELQSTLIDAGYVPHITAVDLMINAFLVKLFSGGFALVDKDAQLLQLDLFGLVINRFYDSQKDASGLIKRKIREIYLACFQPRVLERLHAPQDNKTKAVKLLSRRISANTNLSFLEHDILKKFPSRHLHRYDCIRAANILNRSYFTDVQIKICIENLSECLLQPNGILCIVRTDEGEDRNNGAILRFYAEGNARKEMQIGDQTEINRILAYTFPP